MSITAKVTAIREEYEKEANNLQEKSNARIERWKINLIEGVYDRLQTGIRKKCGWGKEAVLEDMRGVPSYERYGIIKILERYFEESCGLGIDITHEPDSTTTVVKVDLSGPATIATVEHPDGSIRNLDFPSLIRENEYANQALKKALPTLAENLLEHCKKYLEAMPNKYYGIDETTEITISRDNVFKFCGREVSYLALTADQVDDLIAIMNIMIAHADIELNRDKLLNFALQLIKNPTKVVKDSYFDYRDFYEKYDTTVSPELTEIFERISHHLVLPHPASQFVNLSFERVLCYQFRSDEKAQFFILQKKFQAGLHREHLIEAVEKANPGIMVTRVNFKSDGSSGVSFRGCNYGHNSRNERIEFCYIVNDAWQVELSEALKQHERIGERISNIARYRIQDIAQRLADVILTDIQENGLYNLIANDCNQNYLNDELSIAIEDEDGKVTIDLAQIKSNTTFINSVARTTERLLDGLAEISFTESAYYLQLAPPYSVE